jgi:inhibitor of KinA sporulation pathway (predicted exonuclease)
MNFIIYDLEATCWKGRPISLIQETIEVGAVKVNRYGEVKGVFNRFVKPIVNPLLSTFCVELTSIEQHSIDRASKFPAVLDAFIEWAEIFETDYLMCSWGAFDQKMLLQDCNLHKLESAWLDNHLNLKQQYQQIRGLKEPIGLKSAVNREGFEFDGMHHRGIDDAKNLAKIFLKLLDEWVY